MTWTLQQAADAVQVRVDGLRTRGARKRRERELAAKCAADGGFCLLPDAIERSMLLDLIARRRATPARQMLAEMLDDAMNGGLPIYSAHDDANGDPVLVPLDALARARPH